jgi:hypothetical protein
MRFFPAAGPGRGMVASRILLASPPARDDAEQLRLRTDFCPDRRAQAGRRRLYGATDGPTRRPWPVVVREPSESRYYLAFAQFIPSPWRRRLLVLPGLVEAQPYKYTPPSGVSRRSSTVAVDLYRIASAGRVTRLDGRAAHTGPSHRPLAPTASEQVRQRASGLSMSTPKATKTSLLIVVALLLVGRPRLGRCQTAR